MKIKGVTKRGKNTYRFTLSLGFDGNGNNIRKTRTFKVPEGTSDTKAEKLVMAAYSDFQREYKYSQDLEEHMRFNELVEIYFRDFAPNELKPVTRYNYEKDLAIHITPIFGNRKIMSIKTSELTTFFTHMDLSSETTRKLRTIMSSVMNFGVKQGYIPKNPCHGALYKKETATAKKIKYLDDKQSRKLMELTSEYSIFNTIIQMLLFTGLRIGECLCLEWDDIDFEHGTVSVSETLAYAYYEKYASTTKNTQSVRTLKLGEYSMALLKRHKEKQDELKAIVGKAWKYPTFVFTTEIGEYINYGSINDKLKALLEENELPILTVHALRHTNASLMINSGVDIKAVSARLGHCNISITADTYGHIFDAYQARIEQSVEDKLL